MRKSDIMVAMHMGPLGNVIVYTDMAWRPRLKRVLGHLLSKPEWMEAGRGYAPPEGLDYGKNQYPLSDFTKYLN